MTQENKTKDLEGFISSKLRQSEMWAVLRMDDEGIHLHMPNKYNEVLFAAFFLNNPKLLKTVNDFVKAEKTKNFTKKR